MPLCIGFMLQLPSMKFTYHGDVSCSLEKLPQQFHMNRKIFAFIMAHLNFFSVHSFLHKLKAYQNANIALHL